MLRAPLADHRGVLYSTAFTPYVTKIHKNKCSPNPTLMHCDYSLQSACKTKKYFEPYIDAFKDKFHLKPNTTFYNLRCKYKINLGSIMFQFKN